MAERLSRVQQKRGFLEPARAQQPIGHTEQKQETIGTITQRLADMRLKMQSPAVQKSRNADAIERHYIHACAIVDMSLNEESYLQFIEYVASFNEAAELFEQKIKAV